MSAKKQETPRNALAPLAGLLFWIGVGMLVAIIFTGYDVAQMALAIGGVTNIVLASALWVEGAVKSER